MISASGMWPALLTTAALAAALAASPAAAAPASDLRAGFIQPPRNQGARNTCSAFVAAGLAEYLIKAETGRSVAISTNYAYWAGREHGPENDFVRDLYAGTDGLAGYLAVRGLSFGVVAESDWPYVNAGTPSLPSSLKTLPYRFEPEFIERANIADFLAREKRPVAMNLMLYLDQIGPRGDLSLPTAAQEKACKAGQGTGCYGHVVLLAGYDPTTDRFLFRNSWGASWGDGGNGTVPAAYVERHCEACEMLRAYPRLDPRNREFLERVSRGVSARVVL